MPSEVIAQPRAASAGDADNHQTIAFNGPRKLLLAALKEVRYGTLTLITPDKRRMVFSGTEPGQKAQLRVYDWRGLDDTVTRGQMGFADGYLNGTLDSDDMPALLTFFLLNLSAIDKYFYGLPWHMLWMKLRYGLQANTRRRSRHNVASHYDLGNDFYKLWLDEGMTYSGALFEGDAKRSLEEAQQAKYRRILRKLNAKPGEHVLEIGCGWGGFAEAAANEGLRVTAITLSEQQATFARERLKRAELQFRAMVELADYREVSGQYDHIVSIGMFEHVGEKYWPEYFTNIRQRLKPGGKAMIQSITLDEKIFKETHNKPGFMETYIFPGGMLPSPSRFCEEVGKAGLTCRDVFTFGQDYKRTLEHWLARFEAKTDAVRAMGRDEYFIRLWRFYLAGCIAAFATGRTSVMQAELTHAATGNTSTRNVVPFRRRV